MTTGDPPHDRAATAGKPANRPSDAPTAHKLSDAPTAHKPSDAVVAGGSSGREGRRGDRPGQPGGAPGSLATRQAELVEALTSGKPVPPGFDLFKVDAARVALLRKRAGEVARQWPMLAAGFRTDWTREFAGWAATRPTQGSLRDGWDLARDLLARGALPATAGAELAEREARWLYDGASAPRTRRAPAVRSAAGAVVLQFAGHVRVVRRGW